MIGPHEGKELELMLAGEKHLAVYHDVIRPGYEIPETVIPEDAFSSYVKKGTILRFSQEFSVQGSTIRYVCFTTPSQSWRAHAFLWIKQEGFLGTRPFDEAYEYFIGRLLGYEESDIAHFLTHSVNFRRTGS